MGIILWRIGLEASKCALTGKWIEGQIAASNAMSTEKPQ
jgi:hypothetical protein